MGEMNIDNIKAQMRKGILEYCILSIISRNDAYASSIIAELKAAEMIVVEGTLYPHLAEMDNAVHRQIEQTMQTLMQQSAAPNRQTDPMGWTQWMNALQSQAEELAMQQIYSL